LGHIAFLEGRLGTAIEQFTIALAWYQRLFPYYSRDVGKAYSDLGTALERFGDARLAVEYLRRAVDIGTRVRGAGGRAGQDVVQSRPGRDGGG
jgi:outer membrane protein TolC